MQVTSLTLTRLVQGAEEGSGWTDGSNTRKTQETEAQVKLKVDLL